MERVLCCIFMFLNKRERFIIEAVSWIIEKHEAISIRPMEIGSVMTAAMVFICEFYDASLPFQCRATIQFTVSIIMTMPVHKIHIHTQKVIE